jgi:hypothetical protein
MKGGSFALSPRAIHVRSAGKGALYCRIVLYRRFLAWAFERAILESEFTRYLTSSRLSNMNKAKASFIGD